MIAPSPLTSLAATKDPPRLGAPVARRPRRRRIDPGADVAIRFAGSRDARALEQLEQLDGRSLTAGARLVAQLGGVTVAAITVADDTVVADPFARTSGVVDLLRVRARQMRIAA
jgi:hypothetical protein